MMLRKIDAMHEIFGVIHEKRCADCEHLCSYTANRKWYKCDVYGKSQSNATDWNKSYEACGMFNKEYGGEPIYKHKPNKHILDKTQLTLLDD